MSERGLWAGVIRQAVEDLFYCPAGLKSGERQSIRDWFLDNPQNDCSIVCEMAGVEYTAVRERVLRRLQGGGRG